MSKTPSKVKRARAKDAPVTLIASKSNLFHAGGVAACGSNHFFDHSFHLLNTGSHNQLYF
jgi:hypothetical protein